MNKLLNLTFVGYILSSLSIIKEWIWRVWSFFAGPSEPLKDRFGPWAIVTGSTNGIGKSIALQLASENLNLILVGRSIELLKQAEKEITEKYPVSVKLVEMNLGEKNATDQLEAEIKDIKVGIFVHSAGLSYESAMRLEEVPKHMIDEMIAVNLTSAIRITQLLLPEMRRSKKGALIYVGSGASVLPTEPLYAAYVASKAGIEKFAQSLQVECKPDNILVQCQTPLLVTTKLSKIKKTSFTVLSPQTYAKQAVDCLKNSTPTTLLSTARCPSLVHAAILSAAQIIPMYYWSLLRYAQTSNIRQRFLAKKQ